MYMYSSPPPPQKVLEFCMLSPFQSVLTAGQTPTPGDPHQTLAVQPQAPPAEEQLSPLAWESSARGRLERCGTHINVSWGTNLTCRLSTDTTSCSEIDTAWWRMPQAGGHS